MTLSKEERHLRAQIAANTRWSRGGRAEQGQKIRAAKIVRFETMVDPDGKLASEERAFRAEKALSAEMQRLAFKSVQSRRLKASRR